MFYVIAYLAIGFCVGLALGMLSWDLRTFSALECFVLMPLFFSMTWVLCFVAWLVSEFFEWRNRRWLDRETKKLGL